MCARAFLFLHIAFVALTCLLQHSVQCFSSSDSWFNLNYGSTSTYYFVKMRFNGFLAWLDPKSC